MTEQTEEEMSEEDAAYWTAENKLFHEILSILEARTNNAKQRIQILSRIISFIIEGEYLQEDKIDTIEGVYGFLKWQYVQEQHDELEE